MTCVVAVDVLGEAFLVRGQALERNQQPGSQQFQCGLYGNSTRTAGVAIVLASSLGGFVVFLACLLPFHDAGKEGRDDDGHEGAQCFHCHHR